MHNQKHQVSQKFDVRLIKIQNKKYLKCDRIFNASNLIGIIDHEMNDT